MHEINLTKGISPLLWLTASLCAVALHACVGLAIWSSGPDSADGAVSTPAIEIGLELLAPRTEPAYLPPARNSDASVTSQAIPEQQADTRKTELPEDIATRTEKSDRPVTLDEPSKPKEDAIKTKQAASAAPESAASDAKAMPAIESAILSTRSIAPADDTGKGKNLIKTAWQKSLIAHLDKHKRYPSDRSLKGAELEVELELDRMGHVLSVRIARSSGDTSFDDAALAMVRRADPVPPPPPLVADDGLNFTLPVVFRGPTRRNADRLMGIDTRVIPRKSTVGE